MWSHAWRFCRLFVRLDHVAVTREIVGRIEYSDGKHLVALALAWQLVAVRRLVPLPSYGSNSEEKWKVSLILCRSIGIGCRWWMSEAISSCLSGWKLGRYLKMLLFTLTLFCTKRIIIIKKIIHKTFLVLSINATRCLVPNQFSSSIFMWVFYQRSGTSAAISL